mgnify:CR=1 FL=1
MILQCPRAGQYTLDLVLSCEGYADLPVQIQISVSEPSQSIALSAKGFDAYAPTVEVGSSIILDAATVSEDTVLTVTADNSIVTATVGEDKRITITAVEEGTGSVTIHASTPGYQDAELTLQVHSVPELIPMTILGDRLERNNVVHLAEGEIVELTVLNPSEGDLSHEIDDPAIVSAVRKSNNPCRCYSQGLPGLRRGNHHHPDLSAQRVQHQHQNPDHHRHRSGTRRVIPH